MINTVINLVSRFPALSDLQSGRDVDLAHDAGDVLQ
jgi:hypothetical protein